MPKIMSGDQNQFPLTAEQLMGSVVWQKLMKSKEEADSYEADLGKQIQELNVQPKPAEPVAPLETRKVVSFQAEVKKVPVEKPVVAPSPINPDQYLNNLQWTLNSVSADIQQTDVMINSLKRSYSTDYTVYAAFIARGEERLQKFEQELKDRLSQKSSMDELLTKPRELSEAEITGVAQSQKSKTEQELRKWHEGRQKTWNKNKNQIEVLSKGIELFITEFTAKVNELKSKVETLKELLPEENLKEKAEWDKESIKAKVISKLNMATRIEQMSRLSTETIRNLSSNAQSINAFQSEFERLSESFNVLKTGLITIQPEIDQILNPNKKQQPVDLSESVIQAVSSVVSKEEIVQGIQEKDILDNAWKQIATKMDETCKTLNWFNAIQENEGVPPSYYLTYLPFGTRRFKSPFKDGSIRKNESVETVPVNKTERAPQGVMPRVDEDELSDSDSEDSTESLEEQLPVAS